MTKSFANTRRDEVPYEWFSQAEIAGYERALPWTDAARIDDATWKDLGVDALMRKIAMRSSIFGRQLLYMWLRRGEGSPTVARTLQDCLGSPVAQQLRAPMESVRHEMRCVDVDLSGLLFCDEANERGPHPLLRWAPHAGAVALLIPLAVHAPWAFLPLVGFVCFSAAIQVRHYASLRVWHRRRRALVGMMECARTLAMAARGTAAAGLAPFEDLLPDVERTKRALAPRWYERALPVTEYLNLVLLYEYARLPAEIEVFERHRPALRRIYLALSEWEMVRCLVEHLEAEPVRCWAQRSGAGELAFEGLLHPLVALAQPLSFELEHRGAFLTGQNGVGKSTLLRSIGLSAICARSFGYAYARRALLPMGMVWTSMGHEDSLETGESLYMAEMKRARQLTDAVAGTQGALVLVDEIFRGTNNIESMSAAAAVLANLSSRASVVASSHNVLLAPMLREAFASMRLVRGQGGLRLEEGVLVETNGLELLRTYALPTDVQQCAQGVCNWLTMFMLEPAQVPDLRTLRQTSAICLGSSSSPR